MPLFRRQIEQGGPVTVTHPEVTRYFMTISEAAQLIIQAGAMGQGGELFVLEMGTPIKIADMARDLIRLSGKEPDQDVQVVFTGLREGEKLYEELITADENVAKTNHAKIMVLRSNGNGRAAAQDYKRKLQTRVESLYRAAIRNDTAAIRTILKEIVPEYTPIQNVAACDSPGRSYMPEDQLKIDDPFIPDLPVHTQGHQDGDGIEKTVQDQPQKDHQSNHQVVRIRIPFF